MYIVVGIGGEDKSMRRVYVAIGVLAFAGFAGLSWWSRTDEGREWFVVGPHQECAVAESSIQITPDNLTVNGEITRMAWAKTQVAGQEFTISGVLSIYGPEDPTGESGNHSLRDIWLSTGEVHIWLTVQGMTNIDGVMNHWWSGYMTDRAHLTQSRVRCIMSPYRDTTTLPDN